MSLTDLLEIIITLGFLYLLFSQITLSVMELYAGLANMRGAFQYRQLRDALGPGSTELIYKSASIASLNRSSPIKPGLGFSWMFGGKENLEKPTYISARLQQQGLPIGWWRRPPVVLDSAARNMDDELALPDTFYVPRPGGYVEGPATRKLLAADTAALNKALRAAPRRYHTAIQPAKVDGAVASAQLALTQLALQQPVDYSKIAAAETSVRNALATANYLAAHDKPSKKDSAAVADLLAAYRALLAQVQQAKPVRWGYKPFYMKYRRLGQSATEALSSTGGNVVRTHTVWQRTCIDPSSPEGQAVKALVDGRPEFTGKAAGWLSLLGWLLTGAAMMVGAPFWFDLLSRFVNIRNVGIKPAGATK